MFGSGACCFVNGEAMDSRSVVVITGATNGLGRLAALDLARSGAHLGIVARSQTKVDELRGEIAQMAPGTPVDSFLADLTSLHQVRRAGQQIDSFYERIDVSINNAGVHAFAQRITPDGFCEMTAVSYLAPWVLTNTLRDKLVASTPARVITGRLRGHPVGRTYRCRQGSNVDRCLRQARGHEALLPIKTDGCHVQPRTRQTFGAYGRHCELL
jgi:NAD(P)-dependent dehydrogenase (short-subunit alcohol dehydrogenase family)